MPTPIPRSGDVLILDGRASVQFKRNPILFRVIRHHDWTCTAGWIWLDGYELNGNGDAIERRSVFVQVDGLRRVDLGAAQARRGQLQRNGRVPGSGVRQVRPGARVR